jgi:hypothetical protein
MLRPALAVTLLAACGGHELATHTPIGTAPIGNVRTPPRPLPPECAPRPHEGTGYAPWFRLSGLDCVGAARALDEGWVVLTFFALDAYDRDGRPRWHATLGDGGTKCGAPEGVAVAPSGHVIVSCGYSLLQFTPTGQLAWQVWPGGNHSVGTPLVGADGTIYVGVDGSVYAVAPDGKNRWETSTGWNRYFGTIAPTPSGALMVWTMMAALHSEDDGSGYRFYYEDEPPELLVIDRAGHIIERRTVDTGNDVWPEWVDVTGEGGGRVPSPP